MLDIMAVEHHLLWQLLLTVDDTQSKSCPPRSIHLPALHSRDSSPPPRLLPYLPGLFACLRLTLHFRSSNTGSFGSLSDHLGGCIVTVANTASLPDIARERLLSSDFLGCLPSLVFHQICPSCNCFPPLNTSAHTVSRCQTCFSCTYIEGLRQQLSHLPWTMTHVRAIPDPSTATKAAAITNRVLLYWNKNSQHTAGPQLLWLRSHIYATFQCSSLCSLLAYCGHNCHFRISPN